MQHNFFIFMTCLQKERKWGEKIWTNNSHFKKRGYQLIELDLDLDLFSSHFTIAVLDVFSVGSIGLRFLRVTLNLICRSNIFNIRSYRLFQPRRVF